MKKITMADVAAHANVSKSTVSQYINKRYKFMSESTKLRIEEAIEELNYRPNIIAKSLKQKTTFTIGVIVSNILHSFSTHVIRSIEDYFNKLDFHVIVCNADDDPSKEERYITMLMDKQVDGIIVFPTGGNIDLYNKLSQNNYPVVFLDRLVEGVNISSVLLDNFAAVQMALEHLVENDYKKIALVTNAMNNVYPRLERVRSFKKLAAELQLPIDDTYIMSKTLTNLNDSLADLMKRKPIEAIIAGNDLALMEILKYLKDNHIEIPKDLALISIDDVSFGALYSPPLTAVSQPAAEMGKKAAELLLGKINEDAEDENPIHLFPPTFIERESTKRR